MLEVEALEALQGMAEGVGFEPTEGTRPSTAFKAAAFVHSATPPYIACPDPELRSTATGYAIPKVIFGFYPSLASLPLS